MDNYTVRFYDRAYTDLDRIYGYIAHSLLEPGVAEHLITELEKAIYSLEQFPERGVVRRIGAYGNKGYRQLFVKNYVIIYRVLERERQVHIITVRYAPSNF